MLIKDKDICHHYLSHAYLIVSVFTTYHSIPCSSNHRIDDDESSSASENDQVPWAAKQFFPLRINVIKREYVQGLLKYIDSIYSKKDRRQEQIHQAQ